MKYGLIVVALLALTGETEAQSIFQRADSMMTLRYHKGDIDTTYITRPQTKWTLTARLNVSGAEIETDGMEGGHHFKSEMQADYKTTLSVGVSYLGFSLCASLNPLKMLGRYNDYELNFNSYGRRFGYDVIYQDARNFTGWSETEGLRTGDGTTETRLERITLPADLLSVKTLNITSNGACAPSSVCAYDMPSSTISRARTPLPDGAISSSSNKKSPQNLEL